MRAAVRTLVAALRRIVRALISGSPSPSPVRCLVLMVLMVPPFGLMVLLLRAATWRRGPLVVPAVIRGNLRVDCALPDLIQLYLYVFGLWEPDLTAYIQTTLNRGDGFIDVGANVGYFTLLAAQAVGPTGRVLAIEASPAIHGTLLRTLAMNQQTNQVRAVNMAASDRPGTLTIYSGPTQNIGLTTTVAQRGFDAGAQIAAAPLDQIATREEIAAARLIKIDVEGGEPAVLDGMAAMLSTLRPDAEIMVELSPHWWSDRRRTVADVLKPFLAAGFRTYAMPNNYWPWRYLWPNAVSRPVPVTAALESIRTRLDLVLSRRDLPEL